MSVYVNNCSNCDYYEECQGKDGRNPETRNTNENWCFGHSELDKKYSK